MADNSRITLEDIDTALRSVGLACGNGCAAGCDGHKALAKRLIPLVEKLDERMKMVITQRYGLAGETPKTLQAIGTRINRTRERIRQIQNLGLARLQEMLKEA